MKIHIILLIIGIVLFFLGGYQNVQYEEHSLLVNATITEIKTIDDTDDGPITYKHTYYGMYTVDGKEYTDKKLATRYTSSFIPDQKKGDTVEIRVYPDNPEKQVAEGGLFSVLGTGLIVYAGIVLFKKRKARKMEAQQVEKST